MASLKAAMRIEAIHRSASSTRQPRRTDRIAVVR